MRAKRPYQKRRKRVGIGPGSGHGKTACRGQKGQGSRSGFSQRFGFEGGQNPLYRRLPKRGFSNAAFKKEKGLNLVKVGQIANLKQKEVTPESLQASGLIRNVSWNIKVLGDGEIQEAVTVKAHRFSASAKMKIEKAGGQAVLIESAC